jgi:hypothetical protein
MLAFWLWVAVGSTAAFIHPSIDLRIMRTQPGSLRRLKLCLWSRITWWVNNGLYVLTVALTFYQTYESSGWWRFFDSLAAVFGVGALTLQVLHYRRCPGGDKYPGGFIKHLLGKIRGAARRLSHAGA